MDDAGIKSKPSSKDVTAALGRIRPKHLIVDQGSEFKCKHFEKTWCKAMNILPRICAVGKHGSMREGMHEKEMGCQ